MKIKPEIGVSAFVPHACDIIDDLLTEDMIEQQQLIDEELKFNMHILAEVRIFIHIFTWPKPFKVLGHWAQFTY